MKMNLNEFVTLTAVLSERQSRLQIAQVFEIYHSVFQDNTVFKDAYIGRYQGDQQNTYICFYRSKGTGQRSICQGLWKQG